MTENGGITNDDYIKHPEIYTESFATNEIPTVLEQNWNRLCRLVLKTRKSGNMAKLVIPN